MAGERSVGGCGRDRESDEKGGFRGLDDDWSEEIEHRVEEGEGESVEQQYDGELLVLAERLGRRLLPAFKTSTGTEGVVLVVCGERENRDLGVVLLLSSTVL